MKKSIDEPSRKIQVVHETGVKVTLVERFGFFGGNITAVGVEGFAWYKHEKTIESGGIAYEFEERAKAMGLLYQKVN